MLDLMRLDRKNNYLVGKLHYSNANFLLCAGRVHSYQSKVSVQPWAIVEEHVDGIKVN